MTSRKESHGPLQIPPALLNEDDSEKGLRAYQRAAIERMAAYIESFDPANPRAGLVHMPTGSGKSGVIMTLARFLKQKGPVVVLTPRVGLRELLTKDIQDRFLKHTTLAVQVPRHVVELDEAGRELEPLNEAIIVCTPQMLILLKRSGSELFKRLEKSAKLVLFDEGHYEPARTWKVATRALKCPRIVFTATPFRDDMKLFDVDSSHWYRYSYEEAVTQKHVRSVEFIHRTPTRDPAKFVDDVIAEYDARFRSPIESNPARPRVIIRCERREHIRQIAAILRRLKRGVVAIHDRFADDPGVDEYKHVPDPETLDRTFWIHQYKLLEGIDDARFQMLALFGELKSVRSIVQQIGRVIRTNKAAPAKTAYVLDHSPKARQHELWKQFLQYDQIVGSGDYGKLDPRTGAETLLKRMSDELPKLLYKDGRFRTPAEFEALHPGSLQLPRSAIVLRRPDLSLPKLSQRMAERAEDEDLLFRIPDSDDNDLLVAFHVSVSGSALLLNDFMFEMSLGASVVNRVGDYIFIFEAGSSLALPLLDEDADNDEVGNIVEHDEVGGACVVDARTLQKLYVAGDSTRLAQVSMKNSNIGADQVRARSMTAQKIDRLVPAFDEHAYVLSRATGYTETQSQSGDDDGEEPVPTRRYIGIDRGRVSDEGERVPLDEWRKWTEELAAVMSGPTRPLAIFGRWAKKTGSTPPAPAPRNVLLDLLDAEGRYRVVGSKSPMMISDACAEVEAAEFAITANGTRCRVKIAFDDVKKRYVLESSQLDELYYPASSNSEGLLQYLNREQRFRVIPESRGYIYALGAFYQPLIAFGGEYDDSKTGLLGSMHAFEHLQTIRSEKGTKTMDDNWEERSLFRLIADQGAGTALAPLFSDIEALVCDDLGYESADFIMVQGAGATDPRRRRRVVFIHAKADGNGGMLSASALQEVCGQALKNLSEVSLFADQKGSKAAKWAKPWNGRPHTDGLIENRVRVRPSKCSIEDLIRRTVRDASADREVWLLLGNMLSKSALESQLKNARPTSNAVQVAYLLHSTLTTVAAAGARLFVFCH